MGVSAASTVIVNWSEVIWIDWKRLRTGWFNLPSSMYIITYKVFLLFSNEQPGLTCAKELTISSTMDEFGLRQRGVSVDYIFFELATALYMAYASRKLSK